MVESSAIVERPKRICRGRGRGRGGRCSHHSKVGDVFSSNDDVLVEILARLPLKSIFKFTCVSKRWHQLIAKDYFRVKIIKRNKMDPGPLYLFQTPRDNDLYDDLPTTPRRNWYTLAKAKSVTTNSSCVGSNKFGVGVKVESDAINQGIDGDDFQYFICCSNGLLLCYVNHWIKSLPPWTCPFIQHPYCKCRLFYQHVARNWAGVGIGESIDGLLQVAWVEHLLLQCPVIVINVYHPQDRRWLQRHQFPLLSLRPNPCNILELVVVSFHPLDPNIVLILCRGWIFACHLNTTPMFTERLVRFKLLGPYLTVNPYLPPPWPISPFPATHKKK